MKVKPGELVVVDRASGRYNKEGGLLAGKTQHPMGSVWISVPFVVLAVLRGDHNVLLLGSNGALGWLPETWVTIC